MATGLGTSPRAPCNLGVVSGQNLVGNNGCDLGRRGGIAAGRPTRPIRLCFEDDLASESAATRCAGQLRQHREADGDPEGSHDRECERER